MSQQRNSQKSKRVFFPENKQKQFLHSAKNNLGVTWNEIAEILNISTRTLTDWKREKFTMTLSALEILSEKSGVEIPDNIQTKDRYWYTHKGGRAGGKAVVKKYGGPQVDEKYRKKKWRKWWEEEGKHKEEVLGGNMEPAPIRKPNYSEKVAEFAGIVLGDGGITKRQVVITLHKSDDYEYGKFVKSLIEKLFEVPVSVVSSQKDNVNSYIISRTKLVNFCVNKLGLKKGNKIKQQVDIPNWIKQNKNYSIACARGLMDTDGCVFNHKYTVNGKEYNYKKLSFTSYSEPMRKSFADILLENGIKPRFARSKDVRIDSKKNVRKYFKIFGSNNPKHLQRYNS